MTYRILFIDEQREAHRAFKNGFLDHHKELFTGLSVFPEETLSDMIEVILKENPDAVLTDYSLNEFKTSITHNVEYDGGDLAREIHERRNGFPLFITTALGDDAAMGGADVKIIFEKYRSFNEGQSTNQEPSADRQHLTFSDRLYHEIKSYKKLLEDSSNEFDALLIKRNSSEEGLTLFEEERLIELDGLLEDLIDRKSKIPMELKMPSNALKLEELLALAKEILKKNNHE